MQRKTPSFKRLKLIGYDVLAMVVEDVQWLSIDGEKITKEINKKIALFGGMMAYFESCKSCQSRLGKISSMGTRVTALEIASYQTRKGVKEQKKFIGV